MVIGPVSGNQPSARAIQAFGSSTIGIQVMAGGITRHSVQMTESCWLSRAFEPRAPVPVIRLPTIMYPPTKNSRQNRNSFQFK